MKKMNILLIIQLFIISVHAQEVKFGKIDESVLSFQDSSSVATVLYKSQKTFYDYRTDDGFIQVTEYFKRIKINKKEGLSYANVYQKLYDETAKNKELILGIKGFTYNLISNKVEKSKLKSSAIYDEKINKNWKEIKILMPNVKVGSVIDVKYYTESPFSHNINDVVLQKKIPVNQFDYHVSIPEYFSFDIHENIKSRYEISLVEDSKFVSKHLKWSEKEVGELEYNHYEKTFKYKNKIIKFKEKNIPPLKEEAFSPELNNYAAKLTFDLKSTKSFNDIFSNYASNWDIITNKIYKSSQFGEELDKTNYFKKDLESLLANLSLRSKEAKILKIFNFVKSKIKWNGFNGFYVDLGVKKAYKDGLGNVADINLILVSMLREAGINANPILTSTKSNGIPLYPTRQGFNYVICGIEVENDVLLLDATDPLSNVSVLPSRVLNWQGRIVRGHGSSTWVSLMPKQNSTATTMINGQFDAENKLIGKVRAQKTNYLAYSFRNKYAGLDNENLSKTLSVKNENINIENLKLKNELNKPISYEYEFTDENGAEEIGNELYISPLLFLSVNDNIFNSESRVYPVDFVFTRSYKKIISIAIPNGYKVKSVPESVKLQMSDNLGVYNFLIKVNGNKIQVSEILKINFPIVPISYYQELRELYKQMIVKNKDKIVLEKI